MATSNNEQLNAVWLWRRKDAAAYCGVTERTIDRWLASGVLPPDAKVIIGGTVRFRPDVITQHIESLGDSQESASEVAK